MTRPLEKLGWGSVFLGIMLGLVGLLLAGGGAYLLILGGSPYYLAAGIACLLAAYFYVRGQRAGLWIFLLLFLVTVIWAWFEVGTDFWLLMPRIAGPLVIAVVLILHDIARHRGTRAATFPALIAVAAAVIAVLGMRSLPPVSGGVAPVPEFIAGQGTDWRHYGNEAGGSRFADATQITPANVGGLELAWSYRTGDGVREGERVSPAFQVTPLKIGDTLYFCTGRNRVIALDAETGKERWAYDPALDIKQTVLLNCRGVTWYEAPDGTKECPRRIITGTLDARLIALDADTGKPCEGFGRGGRTDLKQQLGTISAGVYSVTSPPVVANGVIVVNGFVLDGLSTDVPSGVVRAFDALTGAFLWSWDAGAIEENRIPASGENYTRGTPNSWSVMSADAELGLVYLPTGNATPDYVGMHRKPEFERYSSSVVALDIRTGKRRWHFQTVHLDVFDLDVPSQPVLFDWRAPDGGTVPALAQPTKQGHIFILDRRTGKPLIDVEEVAVPQGRVPGERYSPTQPRPAGFATLEPAPLAEKDMWGATALDQLWCRIRFRQLDYRGAFTPPSLKGSLQFPGNMGILNWGSVAIDQQRGIMIANAEYMPIITHLFERAAADRKLEMEGFHPGFVPQEGTPFGIATPPFLSPLGLPCNAPPWGRLAAIDLNTGKFLWNVPFGTTRDHAPLNIAVPGVFNIGGSITTAGGLTFIGASIDRGFHAYDTQNGVLLWRYDLPAGGQATPMSYVSEQSGRQFVVIAAGGHGLLQARTGDYLMGFALPKK